LAAGVDRDRLLVRELHRLRAGIQEDHMNLAARAVVLISVLTTAVVGGAAGVRASQVDVVYSAQVVNLDAPAGAASGRVEIRVTRWSTDAERDSLTEALRAQTTKKLLDVLARMPSVGSIRTPATVGYDLRYGRRTVTTTGAEQILFITDRPIGFVERREGFRSVDYPFTIIRLQLNSKGEGEGQVLAAAKILGNKPTGDIIFEQYNATPVRLLNVRRD
jgi:hypothetical protein